VLSRVAWKKAATRLKTLQVFSYGDPADFGPETLPDCNAMERMQRMELAERKAQEKKELQSQHAAAKRFGMTSPRQSIRRESTPRMSVSSLSRGGGAAPRNVTALNDTNANAKGPKTAQDAAATPGAPAAAGAVTGLVTAFTQSKATPSSLVEGGGTQRNSGAAPPAVAVNPFSSSATSAKSSFKRAASMKAAGTARTADHLTDHLARAVGLCRLNQVDP
jgi:type II secretory pathway component HofQ